MNVYNSGIRREYNSSDYQMIRFYHYETWCYDDDVIDGVSDLEWEQDEDDNTSIKTCFEELLKRAEEKVGHKLFDNKIAIEVCDTKGETIFFSHFDAWWKVSTAVRQGRELTTTLQ